MRVTVRYFATLRDRAGVASETVQIPDGSNVADLKGALATIHLPLSTALDTVLVSVNREYALPGEVLHEGDEVAVFPPVSGGEAALPPTHFRITEEALDLNALVEAIVEPSTGAVCVFTGTVRAQTERDEPHETSYLEYEAYVPMAEEMMRRVAKEIRERWPAVGGISIVQRVGRLDPGTPTVLIACAASHRDTGVFEAARYGIDRLKEIVPIWKKEVGPEGETWVEGHYHPDSTDRRP